MSDPIHSSETRYGFEYGALSVERMFHYKGYVGVRLVCYETGEYVDIQASPKGRSISVTRGKHESLKEVA